MSNNDTSRFLIPVTVVVFTAAFASTILAAPAPKEKSQAKPEQEAAAEPVPVTILNARAIRLKSVNNLKQLGIAMHNYHGVNGHFATNIKDKNGKLLLSWRVHLLPYIEQNNLYNRFKLDEPWDSENNLRLLEEMPPIFASPRVTVKKKGYSVYQGFAGKKSIFDGQEISFTGITDGTSFTIMMVESSVAVPWTKPVDMPFEPEKDLPDFGKAYGSKPLSLMCDGSVRLLDLKKIKPETLKAAITRDGGEVLGKDWDE